MVSHLKEFQGAIPDNLEWPKNPSSTVKTVPAAMSTQLDRERSKLGEVDFFAMS